MSDKYYVFGAHSRARTLYEYLRTLKPQDRIMGFLFDNNEVNQDEVDGITVINLRNIAETELDHAATVYIATRGEYHEGITGRLNKLGFSMIIPVTPELDMDMRNRYVKRFFEDKGKKFNKIIDGNGETDKGFESGDGETLKACLFIAKTSYDSDFEKSVSLRSYEKIIQAGCALTDIRLTEASYFDNMSVSAGTDGYEMDSISDRNSQFSEMTALYWIWKHTEFDFVGLEHWRRRFLLPNNWVDLLERDSIDAILPVPLCVMPSLEENFKGRHVPKVWDTTMEILGEIHPDEYERAVEYFRENTLYSPCNMLIARKKVLDDYCAWIFPLIFKLNDQIGEVADRYQNRYPGFVSERLLTYFFDSRLDIYKVAYADKSFLR